jgi:protein ImuB
MERTLAILLPWWPADRATRSLRRQAAWPHEGAGPPLLLIGRVRGARVVMACCRQAWAVGVRPGDGLAMARDRCSGKAMEVSFDQAADARALGSFAGWCLRYGPAAAAERSPGPAAICVDVSGCHAVHGGWTHLLQRVRTDLTRLHLHAHAAVAGGSAAALVAAAHRSWQAMEDVSTWLDQAPLEALRLAPEIPVALEEVGVRTIGQMRRLGARALADRFGEGPWHRLRLASGLAVERIACVVPGGPLRCVLQFDGPTSRPEALQQAVQGCLRRLVHRLRRRCLGSLHLRVHLQRACAKPTRLEWRLARPSRGLRHLWRLMQPDLERVHLGHDPSQGIERVQVASLRHVSMGLGQAGLLHGAVEDQGPSWAEWIDRMRQRLGAAGLRVPHAEADPDEARAWSVRPMTGAAASAPSLPPESLLPLRPVVRVAPPRAIEVACDARRRPVQVRLRSGLQPVQAAEGPERVEGAWWRGERGTQDRWRVLADGAWWWLRRDGAVWWLEGAWT